MRNHQDNNGNRYQFRLHPAQTSATTVATAATNTSQTMPVTMASQQQQQQLQQKPQQMSKIEEDQQQQQQQQQNLNTNNNNNNNNNDKTKINNSSAKCSTTTILSQATQAMLKDNNTDSLLHHRKQFTPTSDVSNASFSSASVAGSIQDDMSDQCSLTQAGLEEYNIRASYYDQPALFHHQKQSSYAQSEGYHSYVSSSDSSSATPFLDRLRQESELLSRQSHHWSQNDISSMSSNSVAPSPTPLILASNGRSSDSGLGSGSPSNHQQQQQHNNSSESTSSTETLKWLGSMSDVSEASHVTGYSAISESVSSSQLIVHSSRVPTPKRHHSESVLYLNDEQQHSPNSAQSNQPQTQAYQPQISPTLSAREYSPTRPSPPNHRHSPSYPPVHTSFALHPYHQLPQQQQQRLSSKREICSSVGDFPKSSLVASAANSSSSPSLKATLVSESSGDLQQQHKSSISVTISNSEAVVTISPQPPPVVATKPSIAGSVDGAVNGGSIAANDLDSSDSNTTATPAKTAPLSVVTSMIATTTISSTNHSPPTSLSATSPLGGSNNGSSYRSNHRLFPVNTYTEPVHSNTSQYVHHPKPQYSAGLQKPSAQQQPQQQQQQQQQQIALNASQGSPCGSNSGALSLSAAGLTKHTVHQTPPSWQSVAELINDFERSTEPPLPQKYAFIEPSKTHRVSNPALKAFQKNAVQSYFERQQHQQHQQQQQQHSKDHNNQQQQQKIYQPHPSHHHLQQQQMVRPHSFQAVASAKEVATQQLLRNSLPNTYGSSSAQHQQLNTMRGGMPSPQQAAASTDDGLHSQFPAANHHKPPSPAPPPPPPRSRSLMQTLLRRSSSASDYAEFRDQYMRASQEKLQSQSIKNISSSEKMSFNDCGMPPPPPPPRGRASLPVRRTSSASEHAAMRDKVLLQQAAALAHQQHHPHQHNQPPRPQHYYTAAPPPSTSSSSDGWVPERPPKNPNLRVPSPDLPPPPADIDTNLSDEPLPPPPPEILHRNPYYESVSSTASMVDGEEPISKAPSPNRRNSFAGSSTRKSFFGRSTSTTSETPTATAAAPTKVPPLIPKKPSSIELLQISRPASSLAQQSNKAHKILLNGGGGPYQHQTHQHHQHQQQQQQQHQMPPPVPQAVKIGANRKRPHHPAVISVPPIMENSAIGCIKSSLSTTTATKPSPPITTKASPPPPLMPRMPITSQGPNVNISSKLRCNSKASYLPRQSLEKLNNSDPDHGSYKLTLTSNEDLVATNTKPNAYDILTHNGKMSTNNLPDVLPLGAKLQPQSASHTAPNNHSPLRTGSNNNLSTMHSPTQQQAGHCYPMYPPMQHRYSTPAPSSNSYNSSRGTHTPNYTRSQSFNANASSASPTKFMSQSTIDLKKTHHLETTHEETVSDTAKVLSPAQSESNLSSPTKSKPLSPCSARREFHRSNDYSGQMAADEQRTEVSEGRIFRAEPISTTLPPTSPCGGTVHKSVTRKDSLRENIEKITQLQSKLMSAHLSDSCGLLSGYGTPTSALSPTAKPTDETMKPASPKSDNTTEMSETTAQTAHSSMADATPMPPQPQTPPPQSAENQKSSDEVNAMAASQISQMDSSTDGLKLMQRSEIILRVNPSTVETASQTDDLLDCDLGLGLTVNHSAKEDAPTRTTLQPRQRHPIEIDCDNMSQELASLLSPNDKLIAILTPQTIKTPADYVSNLYNPEVPLRPAKRDVGTSTLMRMKMRESSQESSEKSAVVMELQYAEIEVSLMNGSESDSCDLMKKKVDELIKHLNRKIRILNNEQTTIGEESALNDELGSVLIDKLAEKVRPIEATKFRTFIDDVGHITSLLLSLSERLARSENGLSTIGDNSAEKKTLETKRDRLLEQLEEAKRLKEDIDRRGASVTGMLEKNLSSDAFADFDYFINMKAKLIADTRDIADKIKCGEEQLSALSEALIQSDC